MRSTRQARCSWARVLALASSALNPRTVPTTPMATPCRPVQSGLSEECYQPVAIPRRFVWNAARSRRRGSRSSKETLRNSPPVPSVVVAQTLGAAVGRSTTDPLRGLGRRRSLVHSSPMNQPPAVRQDAKSWQAGYKAGHSGKPSTAPPGVDPLSWVSGFIEGQADRQAGRVRPVTRPPTP